MAKLLWVPGLTLALLVLAAPTDAGAQTQQAEPTAAAEVEVPRDHAPLIQALPWLGSIVARRVIATGWFSLVGARVGAGMGAETAAALGLAGLGTARALPSSTPAAVTPRLTPRLPPR
jgi:hypothetical protein